MAQELENRQAHYRRFEFTSAFHLITEPRETLQGQESRILRVERSEVVYIDGIMEGSPKPLYSFEVNLEDFAQGVGGTLSSIDNFLDNQAAAYKARVPID